MTIKIRKKINSDAPKLQMCRKLSRSQSMMLVRFVMPKRGQACGEAETEGMGSIHVGRPWHQRRTASSLRAHGEGPHTFLLGRVWWPHVEKLSGGQRPHRKIPQLHFRARNHALPGGLSFCCPLPWCRALCVWAGGWGLREVCCLEAEPPPETSPHCSHCQKVHNLGSAQPDRVPDKILHSGRIEECGGQLILTEEEARNTAAGKP